MVSWALYLCPIELTGYAETMKTPFRPVRPWDSPRTQSSDRLVPSARAGSTATRPLPLAIPWIYGVRIGTTRAAAELNYGSTAVLPARHRHEGRTAAKLSNRNLVHRELRNGAQWEQACHLILWASSLTALVAALFVK